MRSIIAEDAQSALPIPVLGPHPRLDRVSAATSAQLRTALIFLSAVNPDAFDYAMSAAEPEEDDNPGGTGEAEPVCGVCGGSIGIFLERGLDWHHYVGDGLTVGEQEIYDPGHDPAVTWHILEDPQMRY